MAAWLEASPARSALGLVVVHGDALLQHPEEQGVFLEQLDRLLRGQRRLQVRRTAAARRRRLAPALAGGACTCTAAARLLALQHSQPLPTPSTHPPHSPGALP